MNDLGLYDLDFGEVREGVTLCYLTVHLALWTRVVEAQQGDWELGELHVKFLNGEALIGWNIHADQSLCFPGKCLYPFLVWKRFYVS